MEFGTDLGSGIFITIIGMGTVLFSLIIVAGLINLIKVVAGDKEKEETTELVDIQPTETAATKDDTDDSEKVVAAISAALAVMMKDSSNRLIVRRITNMDQGTTIWCRTARTEQINSSL